jgi:hypothetical protein
MEVDHQQLLDYGSGGGGGGNNNNPRRCAACKYLWRRCVPDCVPTSQPRRYADVHAVFWALGSVVGMTCKVDMLTYRRKGVIRILVGIMNKDLLPLTTDIVFCKEGYNVTFALEPEEFAPAILPFVDEGLMDRDKDGNGKDADANREKDQITKKNIKTLNLRALSRRLRSWMVRRLCKLQL